MGTAATPATESFPAPVPFTAPMTAPELPSLLTTALSLELAVQAPSIDLGEAAAIVLRDPFAVLDLFCRAAGECGVLFERVVDCLAALPCESWPGVDELSGLDEWSAETPAPQARMGAFADHAVRVAERCQALARAGYHPAHLSAPHPEEEEKAYLAGLLHEAAMIPLMLGWPTSARRIDAAPWVPSFLCDMLAKQPAGEPWRALVEAAHVDLFKEALHSA